MANEFTIGIRLKPYVARYLRNNFGDPVDLYNQAGIEIKDFMISLLKKPSRLYDSRIINSSKKEETRIFISNSDFYRYGWEMTKTNQIRFNNKIESLIKFYSRTYIAFDKSLGIPISQSIRNFQKDFDFPEDIWSYEAIKKDFDRNGQYIKFDKIAVFRDNLKNIFLQQMSDFRQFA